MRSSAALEAGCGAGGRKPAVHLVDAETDDGIARFRRGRRLQATDRGHAAADQAADVGIISGLIRLRAADGDDDVATIRAPTTTATSRRPIPSPSASLKGRAVLSLCEFRRRHLEDFQALFVEVVRLAQELGLARLGKLSIDGTKVRANASKRKAMSYDRMQAEEQRLESEIEALLRQADAVDEAEDARLGAEVRGDDLPAELRRREERLAAIREAKARLEAVARAADDARGRQPGQDRNPKGGRPYKRAYGEPDEKAQSNFTDPESSIMKTSNEGFQQCYNAQVTVDAEHQLVVATDLTANASDQGELPVLLDAVKETFAAQPETVLADAGYCNERDLTDLEKRGIDGYVALGREGKQTATRDREAHPATARMVEKLATPAGRTAYAERKWLSEAPNGWIKHVLGFRRFSLRGLAKVRCEWDLVCLALNVKRLQPLMAA